jgi:hypothetical protein
VQFAVGVAYAEKAMSRHSDIKSLGRSKVVPYIEGELPADRHVRRLEAAMHHRWQTRLENWCTGNGCTLIISNHGQHWRITGNLNAEWWPSSAKLVMERRYDRGIHCHDVAQLLKFLDRQKRTSGASCTHPEEKPEDAE